MAEDSKHPPVLVFGGMGADCHQPVYASLVKKVATSLNTHVECYPTGVLGSVRDATQGACEWVQKHKIYSKVKQISLLGLSQGGLFARSILEECDISA